MQTDHVADLERQQYAKLLSLERKELLTQKQLSDTWVRYIFLLLERTMAHCARKSAIFHTMSGLEQTLVLRTVANELRARCRLPPSDAVYDPTDAEVIVRDMLATARGIPQTEPVAEVAAQLEAKYGTLLKSVSVRLCVLCGSISDILM